MKKIILVFLCVMILSACSKNCSKNNTNNKTNTLNTTHPVQTTTSIETKDRKSVV